jgi:hypothetical protein
MAINFPNSPQIGDQVQIGTYVYTWTGDTWDRTVIDVTTSVSTAVANLVDSAPTSLDTLNELAAALGDDASFSTTVNNAIAAKVAQTDYDSFVSATNTSLGTKATTATYTFTIAAADTWTDQTGYFTLAKTVSGLTSSDTPILDLDLAASTVANIEDIQAAWGTVYRAATTTDTITLYALEAPVFPENTPVQVRVVR